MSEYNNKLKELFGSETNYDYEYYKENSNGDVVVGKDEDGKEIVMKKPKEIDYSKVKTASPFVSGMEELLILDKELVKKLTSDEYKEEKEKKRREKDLKRFYDFLLEEGIDPNSEEGKKRIGIYESNRDLLRTPAHLEKIMYDDIEEYKDQLTLDEIELIRESKADGVFLTPEMIIGSREANKKASESPIFHTMEYLKYLSSEDINITMNDEVVKTTYLPKYLKDRRPPIHMLVDECIEYLEKKLINALREKNVDKRILDEYIYSRKKREELVANLKPFELEKDFRIFEYYFKKFGRHKEDEEYFNPHYMINKNQTMGDYFEIFKKRTGLELIDVYYYYYKKDEERENAEIQERIRNGEIVEEGDGVIGEEEIDKVNLNKPVNTITNIEDDDLDSLLDNVEF